MLSDWGPCSPVVTPWMLASLCLCRCCLLLEGKPLPTTLAWSVLGCSAARSAFSPSILILASCLCSALCFVNGVCVCVCVRFYTYVCSTGRILANERDQTSVDHIYAIGSVQHGRPSTTGLSVHAGTLLARRLYRGDSTLVISSYIVILTVKWCIISPWPLIRQP